MSPPADESHEIHPHLSFWDGVSIIVGIVIATSIFRSPPTIFSNVYGPWSMIGTWVLGGALTLVGAYCYAELATTYPYSGGDYAYLKLAFGPWVAFLFGWAQLSVVLTGSIGAMAYVFADYAVQVFGDRFPVVVWATGGVATLTVINILGARVGKSVQNALVVLKFAGLLVLVVAAVLAGGGQSLTPTAAERHPDFGVAMILVLYAYGGWNDAAFVASEVSDRKRNMPRVLILGTAVILTVYVLVNLAYLWTLGFDGASATFTPAADVVRLAFGDAGAKGMSILVMISALGAVNGLLFTGSRISTSLGTDHAVFAFLKRWDPRLRSPVWAIASLAGISLAMIALVGTERGRGWLDRALNALHVPAIPWAQYFGGFETLFAGTAPVFWAFFLLTGISVFVLRAKNPGRERPYSIPWYPLPPIVFCLASLYGLYASLTYAKMISLIGFVPLLVGIPLYFIGRRPKDGDASVETNRS